MIEPLKNRIKREQDYFDLIVSKHLKMEKVLKLVPEKFLKDADLTIYHDGAAFIHLSLFNPLETELELIPFLSSSFDIKWSKEVREKCISYYSWMLFEEVSTYITITLNLSESCMIKKVATGKTKMINKTVQVVEPEFTYLINCNEDAE